MEVINQIKCFLFIVNIPNFNLINLQNSCDDGNYVNIMFLYLHIARRFHVCSCLLLSQTDSFLTYLLLT